uniref:Glycosyl transferase CAP10 domain-containing protein n=1 Tax=Eutreptiella gymnastica TaxID=73025 RepID=A0A7S4LNN4_9EUGL
MGQREEVVIRMAMEDPNFSYAAIIQHDASEEVWDEFDKRDGNHDLSLTIDYFEGYPFEPYASGKRGHVYRVGTYYPFPSRRIPGVKEKVYDVVHTGSTTPPEFFGVLNEFKTVHVCRAWCSGGLNGRRAANFEDKLDIVAQSKIAVVFNVLLTAPAQNISSQSWWGSRKPWLPFYPNNYPWFDGFVQWKARTTEAFFGRALVLYRWDPYYSLERLGFIPDKHFVYYNATPPQVPGMDLKTRLTVILSAWDQYSVIAERGHDYAREVLSTDAWYEDYIATMRKPHAERPLAAQPVGHFP